MSRPNPELYLDNHWRGSRAFIRSLACLFDGIHSSLTNKSYDKWVWYKCVVRNRLFRVYWYL